METEKRRFTRVPFRVMAELTVGDNVYRTDTLNDLSIGGCLLPFAVEAAPGAPCGVRIRLSAGKTETVVTVEGKIVRKSDTATAVSFSGIDPESLGHLRNIIRYNTQDIETVEQEIQDHPGIR